MCTCVTEWVSFPWNCGTAFSLVSAVCLYLRGLVHTRACVHMYVPNCLPERLCVFRDPSSSLLCYIIIPRRTLACMFSCMSVCMSVRLSFRPSVGLSITFFSSKFTKLLISDPRVEKKIGGERGEVTLTHLQIEETRDTDWYIRTRAHIHTHIHTCIQIHRYTAKITEIVVPRWQGRAKRTHAWT